MNAYKPMGKDWKKRYTLATNAQYAGKKRIR